MSRARELAEAHWDGFVGELIALAAAGGINDSEMALVRFAYIASAIHFWKHCEEHHGIKEEDA